VRESGACAIVSTSPPVSAHVAALRAARDAAVPALLDFRDLWTAHRDESDRSRRAQRERRLERDLLRDAAAVTSVSDACVAWLRERHGEDAAGKPFRVLRNGFEAEDFAGPAPPRDPDVFRIVHAGTVYGARQDTSAFFRALARVRAAGTLRDRRVEVVLAGKVDPQTLESARAGGCGDLVLTPGFVDHPTAVGLMRSASVNLLLTWSVEGPVAAGVCPGKMYEQMAAGRPVLALALPSCEAVRILDATGGALVARPDDEAAIERALVRLAEADRAGDALRAAPARTRDLARFSRKSVAAELAELLASIAG
jgi:glycosyltransferase involved in cell wall biosynthesis